jgi:hypothetical protein
LRELSFTYQRGKTAPHPYPRRRGISRPVVYYLSYCN